MRFLRCLYKVFFEFAGGLSYYFTKLATKVFHILVSALFGNFRYALIGKGQEISGFADAAADDVIHAGYAEFLLIEQLQVSHTDMKLSGHFRNVPGKLRSVGNLPAQHQKLIVVGGSGMVQHIASQL